LVPIIKILLRIAVYTAEMTFLVFIPIKAESQNYQVETIIYNGPVTKFINLVFLSEGFKDSELAEYVKKVETSANNYLSESPFNRYRSYFNVFAIRVPSKESGADHPRTAPDCPPESEHPKLTVDTYFNSTFDYNNIHRLLASANYPAINSVILNNFPLFDQNIMLVNTSYYGGSGGSIAVASLHSAVNELVLHESGHTFAGLADEYWPGDLYAGEKANMTKETNPELIKWKNWLGVEDVGIYQHGSSGVPALWYRPSQNCKMRGLGYQFCPVCKEAILLNILKNFGTPVQSYSPEQQNLTVSGESLLFNVTFYKPDPNTLSTKWFLNGKRIAMNADSISLDPGQLVSGINTLALEVLDTTALIRSASHAVLNTDTVKWNILKKTSSTNEIPGSTLFEIYPNPFNNEIHIESGELNQNTEFEIINILGEVVVSDSFYNRKTVETSHFKPGVYIVRFRNDNAAGFKKLVKY
jgi:hypothetical protein